MTQCVFAVGDDRLRIAKAEGRPPGVAGTVLSLRIEDGRPRLSPAPIAARIGPALRAARHQAPPQPIPTSPASSACRRARSRRPSRRGQSGLSLETLLDLAGKLDMRPRIWSEVVRPALADREGWATFIGTPMGKNHFHDLYQVCRA